MRIAKNIVSNAWKYIKDYSIRLFETKLFYINLIYSRRKEMNSRKYFSSRKWKLTCIEILSTSVSLYSECYGRGVWAYCCQTLTNQIVCSLNVKLLFSSWPQIFMKFPEYGDRKSARLFAHWTALHIHHIPRWEFLYTFHRNSYSDSMIFDRALWRHNYNTYEYISKKKTKLHVFFYLFFPVSDYLINNASRIQVLLAWITIPSNISLV